MAHAPAGPDEHKIGKQGNETMSFCVHCEGQRFDRARVLRALRQVKRT